MEDFNNLLHNLVLGRDLLIKMLITKLTWINTKNNTKGKILILFLENIQKQKANFSIPITHVLFQIVEKL